MIRVALIAVVAFAWWTTAWSPAQPAPPVTLEQPGYRYQGKTARWWAKRAVQARKDANARGRTIKRLRATLERARLDGISPVLAIRLVFGKYAEQALRVAWCESRYDVGATNGQYLGLFQMGRWERSRYGHGGSPLEQARAAYRYFVDSGRDWSPWECKP